MNIKTFSKTHYKYLLLIVVIVFIAFAIWKFVIPKSPLTQAQIDQLVMQATFGEEQKSLDVLNNAAQQGQVTAQVAMGKTYVFRHQPDQALTWLNLAAKQHSHEAAALLGKIYFQGEGKVTTNYALAMQWFKQASTQNDAVADYYLGLMYKNGYGTKINASEAVKYFEAAAQQKIPKAMFMLANAYQFGDGVAVDAKQAFYWYKQAADLELPEAIQALAYIYQYGNHDIQANKTEYQQQLLEIGHSLKHPAMTP